MIADFTPDFSNIRADESILSASEFARKRLIEFVKQYAEQIGVTQQAIADITGMRQSNVSRILAGRYSPTLDNFLKIAAVLNLHIDLSKIGKI